MVNNSDCYRELLALGRKIDIFKIIYRVACPVQEVSFLIVPKIEHCLMREFYFNRLLHKINLIVAILNSSR
jgi:hypothetical protein